MLKKILLVFLLIMFFQSISLAESASSTANPKKSFVKYTFHSDSELEKDFRSTIWQVYCDSDTGKTPTTFYYMEAEVYANEVPYTTQPMIAFTINYFVLHPDGTRSYITTNTGTSTVTEFEGIGEEICNSWLHTAINTYHKNRKN